MRAFYEDYYARVVASPAHAEFCERVFGRNLCQHGFASMLQLDALIAATRLGPGKRALDLGCGNGMIAEYIADCTGAHVTGIDLIPTAVQQAQTRCAAKAERLDFAVGDVNALQLPAGNSRAGFDTIISIDSLYFCEDLARTLRELAAALRPEGEMALFYSQGREPWVPVEQFQAESVLPDRTPLAEALQANRLRYRTQDFTDDEHRLAVLRAQVLPGLRDRLAAEGMLFLYENRMGDAQGIRQAVEEGLHRRYLYLVDT